MARAAQPAARFGALHHFFQIGQCRGVLFQPGARDAADVDAFHRIGIDRDHRLGVLLGAGEIVEHDARGGAVHGRVAVLRLGHERFIAVANRALQVADLDPRRGAVDPRHHVGRVQFQRPREVRRRPRRITPPQTQDAAAVNHHRVIGRELRGLCEIGIGAREYPGRARVAEQFSMHRPNSGGRGDEIEVERARYSSSRETTLRRDSSAVPSPARGPPLP